MAGMPTLEEKKKAILEALQSKQYSGNQLNPKGSGKYAGRLLKGLSVSEHQVNEMHSQLCELEGITKYNKVSDTGITKGGDEMQERIMTLEHTVLGIKGEIEQLRKELEGITKDNKVSDTESSGITKYNKVSDTELLKDGESFMGFKIRREQQSLKIETKEGEKKVNYTKYFAKKKVAGKLHRVYLGSYADKELTKKKIDAYCQKHGLSLAS